MTKGILFNDNDIRAILEGTKTQTRRLVKKSFIGCENEIAGEVNSIWGKPGDKLLVAEAFEITESGQVLYKADGGEPETAWSLARNLPRQLARIRLEITELRIEKLQNISDADVLSEGVSSLDDFRSNWESIQAHGSWDKNPWVWVISFRVSV